MATSPILALNEAQNKAYVNINRYILNDTEFNYLLLGPAGSGKTTVIVNVFNHSTYKIAFCAFTNKATQVLRNIAAKFDVNFVAEFMTIHKLLLLEPKYLDNEFELAFTFDKNKVESMKDYDVIIFDECSTISAQLYQFLCEAWEFIHFKHDKKIKFIFLGDFWQLPPVGEEKSVIFTIATANRWKVSKLDKVMRSANDDLRSLNENLLSWITKFKNKEVSSFVQNYPYNLVPRTKDRYLRLDTMIRQYLKTWKLISPDTVILTYSRANCEKTNFAIQDEIDEDNGREIPERRELIKFYPGDRCCLDKPIDVFYVKEITTTLSTTILQLDGPLIDSLSESLTIEEMPITEIAQPIIDERPLRHMHLSDPTMITLYNGEIFDIIKAEDIYIHTTLNRFSYMPKHFEGQLLTIRRINESDTTFEVVHISTAILKKARQLIKTHERRMFYLKIMSDFIKKFPKLDYGYCITIYKSQGSEWHTVFVNLNSIKWSIAGKETRNIELKKKAVLFKTTYTALSRASHKLYCLWMN